MTSTGEKWSGFSRLLVATDLTPASDRLLGRIALLPLAADAQLTLLHVIPTDLPAPEKQRAELAAKKTMADEAQHLAASLPAGVTITQVVALGAAAAEIATCSAESHAEMIVMGRGGGSGLRDAFLGSTAERVVRRTQLPVLVVRLAPRTAYQRPALALNTDEAAGIALSQLLKVIPGTRLTVTVIHAYEPSYQRLISPAPAEDDGEEYPNHYRADAAQKIGTLLTAALEGANLAPIDSPIWKMHVRLGSPRFIIAKAAKQAETDLLVMGTRGHSGLAFAFLGTVAGDVLRAVDCDVLVVPPAAQA